jgi:hypothetical protein
MLGQGSGAPAARERRVAPSVCWATVVARIRSSWRALVRARSTSPVARVKKRTSPFSRISRVSTSLNNRFSRSSPSRSNTTTIRSMQVLHRRPLGAGERSVGIAPAPGVEPGRPTVRSSRSTSQLSPGSAAEPGEGGRDDAMRATSHTQATAEVLRPHSRHSVPRRRASHVWQDLSGDRWRRCAPAHASRRCRNPATPDTRSCSHGPDR